MNINVEYDEKGVAVRANIGGFPFDFKKDVSPKEVRDFVTNMSRAMESLTIATRLLKGHDVLDVMNIAKMSITDTNQVPQTKTDNKRQHVEQMVSLTDKGRKYLEKMAARKDSSGIRGSNPEHEVIPTYKSKWDDRIKYMVMKAINKRKKFRVMNILKDIVKDVYKIDKRASSTILFYGVIMSWCNVLVRHGFLVEEGVGNRKTYILKRVVEDTRNFSLR